MLLMTFRLKTVNKNCFCGRGSATDPAGKAYDGPYPWPAGKGHPLPIPHSLLPSGTNSVPSAPRTQVCIINFVSKYRPWNCLRGLDVTCPLGWTHCTAGVICWVFDWANFPPASRCYCHRVARRLHQSNDLFCSETGRCKRWRHGTPLQSTSLSTRWADGSNFAVAD